MDKTKKGLLTASSILTILGAAGGILMSFLMLFLGSIFTEGFMKQTMIDDPACTYYETLDGYYFEELDEFGEIVITTQEDIKMMASVLSGIFQFGGIFILGMSIAKLVLAIRLLISVSKEKPSQGTTVALMILSLLSSSILESILLIVSLCLKDNTNQNKPLGLEDIPLGN